MNKVAIYDGKLAEIDKKVKELLVRQSKYIQELH